MARCRSRLRFRPVSLKFLPLACAPHRIDIRPATGAAAGFAGKCPLLGTLFCQPIRKKHVPKRTPEEHGMSYELDQFIADCRTALKRDPGPARREKVAAELERLL